MSDLQAGSNAAINTPAKPSAARAAGVRIEKAHLAYKQCGDIFLVLITPAIAYRPKPWCTTTFEEITFGHRVR